MSTFNPRSVPIDSWRDWFREGFDLATRRLWLSVPACIALFGIGRFIPWPLHKAFMMGIAPVYLAFFVQMAENTDKGQSLKNLILKGNVGRLRVATLSLSVNGAVIAIPSFVNWVTTIAAHGADRSSISVHMVYQIFFPVGAEASICLAMWMGASMITWFGTPLFASTEGPFAEGFALALQAYWKNTFVLMVGMVIVMIAFASTILLQGLAGIFLYPLLGATLYVSYRDVFLGVPPKKVAQAYTIRSMLPPAVTRNAAK